MSDLLLLVDEKPVLRCPLYGQTLTIGRSTIADITLPDEGAPTFLCALEPTGDGRYRVTDRSGDGIEVSGKRGPGHSLAHGDSIQLAPVPTTPSR
jgi:hypothetical protein